jgi:hypothetical protein
LSLPAADLPGPGSVNVASRDAGIVEIGHANFDGSLRGIPFSAKGATWLAEELPRVAGEVTDS